MQAFRRQPAPPPMPYFPAGPYGWVGKPLLTAAEWRAHAASLPRRQQRCAGVLTEWSRQPHGWAALIELPDDDAAQAGISGIPCIADVHVALAIGARRVELRHQTFPYTTPLLDQQVNGDDDNCHAALLANVMVPIARPIFVICYFDEPQPLLAYELRYSVAQHALPSAAFVHVQLADRLLLCARGFCAAVPSEDAEVARRAYWRIPDAE